MYRHRQFGRTILLALAAMMAVVGLLPLFDRSAPVLVVAGAVMLVLLLTAVICSSLTVTVDERVLRVRFGPGPIRRTIELRDIAAAQPVKNSWWAGYGIHMTSNGWLWNVSGPDAVELTLSDGRRFVVGTDDPAGLTEALARASRASRAGHAAR